jgi:hypothetical protein
VTTVVVRSWAAWAPGIETREAWRDWAAAPVPLTDDGVPDAREVPAMLRRRCTTLSRAMLAAAYAATDGIDRGAVRTVFASRYGSINESVPLLRNIAYDERMSPSRFTHTVHNAQAGLFSIATGNRRASSALSARAETFACGFLESATHLDREPSRPVLLVMGDVTLAEAFASLIDDPPAVYSVALLLAADAPGAGRESQAATSLAAADAVGMGGIRVSFGVTAGDTPAEPGVAVAANEALRRGWADAAEFVRWMLSGETRLVLPGNGREWWWQKHE